MRSMRATWTGEKLAFRVSNDRLPQVEIRLDEPAPLGDDLGFMPTELLLGALGGCVGMNAAALLRKRKLPLVSLAVLVEGTQAEEWPKPFTAIEIVFDLEWSEAPDEELVTAMLDKAVHAYCPVGGTIAATATINHRRNDVVING